MSGCFFPVFFVCFAFLALLNFLSVSALLSIKFSPIFFYVPKERNEMMVPYEKQSTNMSIWSWWFEITILNVIKFWIYFFPFSSFFFHFTSLRKLRLWAVTILQQDRFWNFPFFLPIRFFQDFQSPWGFSQNVWTVLYAHDDTISLFPSFKL